MRYLTFVFAPVWLAAQSLYVPAYAPAAQELVVATKSAHPELKKLGLHAIPPAERDYAIIANLIPSKIGKKSSESDLSVLYSATPSVNADQAGKFFDLCLPISDAIGRPIGVTVMEIPFAYAADSGSALAKATAVREEMQRKIKSRAWLFAESDLPLTKAQAISLPGVRGRFDHLAVDARHNRLFLAAEDERAVLVFDLTDGRMTDKIPVAKPHAILYREDRDRIYVTDGEEGALKIFDGGTYRPLGAIALAKDADSIAFDASRHRLYIDNGGKNAGQAYSLVSVVDATEDKKITDIRVEGDALEAMALDVFRPRLYVNNPAKNQVVVIDRWTNRTVASWPVSRGADNVALALDEQRQRLFVGCRSGQIVVFDSNTGGEMQSFAITKGIDDLQFDPLSRRLYAIGGGKIDVIEEIGANDFRSLGSVAAGDGAKTGRLAPELNRYFAAVPQAGGGRASVEIFQPVNLPDSRPAVAETPQPVNAPRALQLEMAALSAHPDLRKMGLHAVPPGGKDSVIIANANMSRIGVKSTSGDLAAVKDGATYCAKRDDGSFFNLKLPLQDASGNGIGILVMEIPYTSAADEKEAIREAESIRNELARQIPGYRSLFAD